MINASRNHDLMLMPKIWLKLTPITSTDTDTHPVSNCSETPFAFWTSIKKQTLVDGTCRYKGAIPNATTVAGFIQAFNADFRAMRSDDRTIEEGSVKIVIEVAGRVLWRR